MINDQVGLVVDVAGRGIPYKLLVYY